jgi:hypothetical protein
LAIGLGIILDGVPESVVLGLTVLGGGGVSIAFLAAVVLSNMPESIAGHGWAREQRWDSRKIMGLWVLVVVVAGVSVAGIRLPRRNLSSKHRFRQRVCGRRNLDDACRYVNA